MTSKPTTTRFPISVAAWYATVLRTRRIPVDIYRDLGCDFIIAIDHTTTPPTRHAVPQKGAIGLVAKLIARHTPDETLPPAPKPRRAARKAAPPTPAPPAAPPPSAADARATVRTPLDAAMLNGLV